MANYNGILLYENPMNMNPRRKPCRRWNVTKVGAMRLPAPLRRWIPLNVTEIISATGGLAAATMIPGTFAKDTSTNLRKLGRLAVALASAAGAAAVADAMQRGTGRIAMAGGVVGAGAMALAMFTKIQIGTGSSHYLQTGTRTLNLGESRESMS